MGQIYKVRCAATYASYWFCEADNQDEAEKMAREEFRKTDPWSEAAHINDTYEVEEADADCPTPYLLQEIGKLAREMSERGVKVYAQRLCALVARAEYGREPSKAVKGKKGVRK